MVGEEHVPCILTIKLASYPGHVALVQGYNQTGWTTYNSHAHSPLLLTAETNNPCLYHILTSVSMKTIVSDFPFERGTSLS